MATSIATNTLIIPNIPHSFFLSDDALETIRSQWATFGQLHQLIPMKGFGRLMVIYLDTQCAITAKKYMDQASLYWIEDYDASNNKKTAHIVGLRTVDGSADSTELINNVSTLTDSVYEMEVRVYFGQHNPINPDPASLSLQVPDLGRNLLISPPGDPCNQWQQRAESPPNKAILASDLLRALTTVDGVDDDDIDSMEDFKLDDGPAPTIETDDMDYGNNLQQPSTSSSSSSSSSPNMSDSPSLETPILQLSFDHDSLPKIMIQDMDGSLLSQHQQKTNRQRPSATARPPIRT